MKPDRFHCVVCGFGTGPVASVCWDCRGKGAKVQHKEPPKHEPVRGWRCEGCGLTFGGVGPFDEHRTGPWSRRRCLKPAEMRARGMRLSAETGHWGRDMGARKKLAV